MALIKFVYNASKRIARPLGLEVRIQELAIRLGTFKRTVKVPDAPHLIWIEPTNACNLNCIMCDRKAASRRKVGFMNFELFTRIVDEAVGLGVREVAMGLGGEPLLHPRLTDMIEYAKSKGLLVSFNTNANLLNEQKSQAILNSGLDSIIFSVDGANKQTYEKIRLGGDYDIVTKNIKNFLSLRKELGLERPKTILQTIVMKGTENEIKTIIEMWRPIFDKVSVVAATEYGNIQRLSLVHGNANSHKTPCFLLWFSLSILWDGDITVCCNDIGGDLVIGNILESNLKHIWNSDGLKEMRKIHRKHEFERMPRCNDCQAINVDLIIKKAALISEVTGGIGKER